MAKTSLPRNSNRDRQYPAAMVTVRLSRVASKATRMLLAIDRAIMALGFSSTSR